MALFPRSLRCDDTVRLQCYFYRASEASGMPHHDPKQKFISLTWRLGSGPTNQT